VSPELTAFGRARSGVGGGFGAGGGGGAGAAVAVAAVDSAIMHAATTLADRFIGKAYVAHVNYGV
jgi:hypothetical protein